MLDKLNNRLVNVLNEFCDGPQYKILEVDEIIHHMPKFNLDYDLLSNNLTYLQEHQYLDIKYLDEREVCLAMLPKARVHSEENKAERKARLKYYRLAVWSSVGSFLAALGGGFLAQILF